MRCSQQYQQRLLEHGHITCSENSKTPLFELKLALLVGLQVVSSKEEREEMEEEVEELLLQDFVSPC